MKKIFLLLVLSLMTFSLGCSNDDKGNDDGGSDSKLHGKWEAVEEVNEAKWLHLDYEHEPNEEVIEFTADKMKTYHFGQLESNYSYTVKGNEITVAGMVLGQFEISGSTLKIHEKSIDNEPIKSTTIYKKIK